MAWAYVQTMSNIDWDGYERVTRELGDEPPAGLVLHAAGPYDGGVRIIDVWESEDAYERFRDERLVPAVTRAFGAEALAQGPPQLDALEVRNLMRP